MHEQHNQHNADGSDAEIISNLNARVRRINTAARWTKRSNEVIAELSGELTKTIVENAALHKDVVLWQRVAARGAGLDPELLPPHHYIDARRRPQYERFREITVDIDGLPWTIGLSRNRPTGPDPIGELRSWQQNVDLARELRSAGAVRE